jgi:phosphoenolpyruvate carboxylase
MTDSTDDYNFQSSEISLAPLVEDCNLLGSMLDDCLKSEVGTELFNKVERVRALAQCAAQLANKHDGVGPFGWSLSR